MREPGDTTPARWHATLLVLVAFAVVLMPFPTFLAGAVGPDGGRAILLVNDVPLLALAVITFPALITTVRRRTVGAGVVLAGALVVAFAVSFAIQPSVHGIQVLGRSVGLLGLAAAIAVLPPRSTRPIVVIVCAVAVAQTVIALAQLAAGGPLGLTILGESQDPLYARGSALAPRGTMTREYSLLLLGLVAAGLAIGQAAIERWSWMWTAIAAACAIPLGVTFSRNAVGGVALGALGQLMHADGRRRPAVTALAAFIAAGALTGTLASAGWVDRVDQVLVDRPDDVAGDRQTLARQAISLIAERPLTGVGTGRYEVVVTQHAATGSAVGPDWTPHDIPLWVAAETGIPAAALITGLLIVVGVRAWRAGPAARFLFFAVIPFWVFDDLVLTHDQGIVLSGIWLGMIDRYAALRPARVTDPVSSPAPPSSSTSA